MSRFHFRSANLSKEDSELIAKLFQSQYEDLVDYTRFIVCCSDWAEDIVQEAFVIGVQKISDLRESENQVGWLYRTVQNITKNKNRKFMHLNKLMQLATLDKLSESSGIEPSFESYILFSESYKGLLKKADWDILIDFYCNGYQYKDLSEKYHKSISACKMQVMRAKKTLVQALKKISDDNM